MNKDDINKLKMWLGTGSVNIFGLPMSGKDTVGMQLAELLGAKLLSSGMIIRQIEAEMGEDLTGSGALIPTNQFYDMVLPYFGRAELVGYPLVLSSVGRWSGEEKEVMAAAAQADHPIKAAIYLEITQEEAEVRRLAAVSSGDRGGRVDDASAEVFKRRLTEFDEKTVPVLETYERMGLLVRMNGVGVREEVFENTVRALMEKVL